MPRKRRNKKDSLAQKLTFDEADSPGNICESDQTSKSDESQENAFPEVDGPPTASEQPGFAELIPTDFAHRGRLRLAAPGGPSDEDRSSNRFLVTCVCVICLILVFQWVKTEGYSLLLILYHDLWTNKNSNVDKKTEDKTQLFIGLSSLGFLWSLLVSFLLGLSCLFFSWGITYQDSLQPGQFPPSPVSPTTLRKQSGHTFHSSYVMALINGVGVFVLFAWWLSS